MSYIDETQSRVLSDIDIARKDVKERGFGLSIVRGGTPLLRSRTPGISALVAAIDRDLLSLKGASVADRVLGRAAAMLFLYAGIRSIFGSTASNDAVALLKKSEVSFEYETAVPKILNKYKTSICPFEQEVLGVEDPKEAFKRLRALNLKLG